MKIVFLCTSGMDDPLPRGRCLPIARQLVQYGHDVSVLLLHHSYDQLPDAQRYHMDSGVLVHYVGQMHVYGLPGERRYFRPLKFLQVAIQSTVSLAAHAMRLKPDYIHVEKPQPMNGLAGVLARLRSGRLYIDYDDYEAEINRYDGQWQKKIVQLWEDKLPPMARAVSTNTRFIYQRCVEELGIHEKRLVYIPNGLSSEQYHRPPAAQVEMLRSSLGLQGHPTAIYLGYMGTHAHAVDLLIDAFRLLLQDMPEARLLMVGDGDERQVLQAQAQQAGIGDAVVWAGRVLPSATRNYLALAQCSVDPVYDIPVMHSRSPLKIVESMGIGVPVVTSDVGDRREMLADGEAGVLVAPGDAAALADGMHQMLADTTRQARLSQVTVAQAESFRWEYLVQRWMGLYRV
jgi:glycosyltransferase involved in cell wall biosynthesis